MATSSNNTNAQVSTGNAVSIPQFRDWKGGEAITDEDDKQRQRTIGNRTKIEYEKSIPPAGSYTIKGKNLYERLDLHNRDCWWWFREDVNVPKSADISYKRTLMAAISGEVEINRYQQHSAFEWLMKLDLTKTGLTVPLYAFCICALVANTEAVARGKEKIYHPQRAAENNDRDFQRLEDSLRSAHPRITKKTLTSVYNKLGQGSPETRANSEWKPIVRQEPFTPLRPSDVPNHFDPTIIGTGGEPPI